MASVMQHVAAHVSSVQLGVRVMLGVVVAFSVGLALLRAFTIRHEVTAWPFLVIVPGVSWAFPWVLFTAGMFSTSWVELLYYIVVILALAPFLERQWGARELLQCSVVIVAASNVCAWFLALVGGLISRSELLLFHTHFDGLHALAIGYLVAYAQLLPDTPVPYVPRFKARDVPMLVVGLSNIPCLLGWMAPFIQYQTGWLCAWIYLRFYQLGAAGQRGDASEHFALLTWFPPLVHPVVGPLGNFVHKIASQYHLVPTAPGYTDLEMSFTRDGDSADAAERRRTMALAALDARLADVGSNSAADGDPTPSSGAESPRSPSV